MRGAYQPELVLHYSEDVGRADAKQQHTVRRLQSTHHPPMVFQNKPRRAAGADRINGVEDRLSQRVERAKPQICRRPNRCLDPMLRGQKKSDHADHRDRYRKPMMQPETDQAFHPMPNSQSREGHERYASRVYRHRQRDKRQTPSPIPHRIALLRTRQGIIESTYERVKCGFTTRSAYHMLWS